MKLYDAPMYRFTNRWTEQLILEVTDLMWKHYRLEMMIAPRCRKGHPIPYLAQVDNETQPFLVGHSCRLCSLRTERERQRRRVERGWKRSDYPRNRQMEDEDE